MINGKSYFVWGLSLCLVAGCGYYVYETQKPMTTPLTVEGKKVIASTKEANVFEEDYIKEINKASKNLKYATWRNTVIDYTIKDEDLTAKDKENIKTYTKNMKTNAKAQFGDDYEWRIKKELAQSGFTNIKDYTKMLVKATRMKVNYVSEHMDDYKDTFDELACRKAVIISCDNTDEAKESASAIPVKETPNPDYTGYIDTLNQNYPSALVQAISQTGHDQETDWVEDTQNNKSYKAYIYDVGYDKNLNEDAMYENAVQKKNTEDAIIYEYSTKLTITYHNDEFKKEIEDYLTNQGVELKQEEDKTEDKKAEKDGEDSEKKD